MRAVRRHVSKVPISESVDHLIGTGEQRLGNREPDVLGSLMIDNEFEFRRLIVGNITRLLALEDLVHGTSELVKKLQKIYTIGHEPVAVFYIRTKWVNGRQTVFLSQIADQLCLRNEFRTSIDEERVGTFLRHEGEHAA